MTRPGHPSPFTTTYGRSIEPTIRFRVRLNNTLAKLRVVFMERGFTLSPSKDGIETWVNGLHYARFHYDLAHTVRKLFITVEVDKASMTIRSCVGVTFKAWVDRQIKAWPRRIKKEAFYE